MGAGWGGALWEGDIRTDGGSRRVGPEDCRKSLQLPAGGDHRLQLEKKTIPGELCRISGQLFRRGADPRITN